MRILADEDFPGLAVTALRHRGHDVVWVGDHYPGAGDAELLDVAEKENRILLTFDKDFGDIAFRRRLPITCGIVLFRCRISSLRRFADFAVEVLESRDDWSGNFALVEWTRIRMRPMR